MKKQSNYIPKERLVSVNDLVEIAGRIKASTVAIPGGHRKEDLRLVESARDHGIVDRIILIGSKKLVSRAVVEVGINIPDRDIIPASNDEQIADATIGLITRGFVDIVLKGGISTPIINRRMLQVAIRPTVSLASIFDASPIAEGRPIILTDAGMTTVCNFGRLVGIIENAVEVARVVMGIDKPKVAVLSANEKQIPSLPSTEAGRKLTERSWSDCVVYGPLSFDLATDQDSVAVKGIPDTPAALEVAGHADILVCPGIDAANILYKTIAAMTKFGQASIAGITIGFQVPYVILSRADTLETRMNSIALCSIYAQRHRKLDQKIRKMKKRMDVIFKILAVYPCLSFIKVALFENEILKQKSELSYDLREVKDASEMEDRIEDIANRVEKLVGRWKIERIDALAVPGGYIPQPANKPLSGICILAELQDDRIVVDQNLVAMLDEHLGREHVTNIGAVLAARLSQKLNVPAYMIDSINGGELLTGKEVNECEAAALQSMAQMLGIREAAKKAAEVTGRPLEEISLIVIYIGEEVTLATLRNGRMIDIDQIPALKGQNEAASFTGEPGPDLSKGSVKGGDKRPGRVSNLPITSIVKKIGALYAASGTDIEAIVLTGELGKNVKVRDSLRHWISPLAPVIVFEGPLEIEALASAAVRVLAGKDKPKHYKKG